MRRALSFSVLSLVLLAACGGGSGSKQNPDQPVTSGIAKRALVSNGFVSGVLGASGAIEIIDAATDRFGGRISGVAADVSRMLLTPDKRQTLIYEPGGRQYVVLDNATETLVARVPDNSSLPDFADDFVVLPDNKTLFTAVRNAPVSGQPGGAVLVLDLGAKTVSATIPVPHVRRLVLSKNGAKLLAFADDSNSMWVIDTAAKTATRVDGFDRPTWGVFSGDDAKAFILSCGAECGGSAASVTVLDLATNTLGAPIAVSGATVGLLDSSNLYVAGNGPGGGKLDVINTVTMTVSKSGLAIGDGFHHAMTLASGKLFIAARTCSTGCLSIVDTSAQSAIVSSPAGDVTGMAPITGRAVVYVTEGGELVIYDTNTGKPQATQVDIVGKANGVVFVD